MSDRTKIQWTDATWNPWHGCHKVSPGCKNCYMFREKKQYGQDPNIVVRSKTKFTDPLKWKEPRLIFTCSWSDWFIEEADEWRDEAWDIIRRTPQHTYQILTKRIERAEGRVPIPALPNIWFGVSVEDQKHADERIPKLLRTPTTTRFISAEPLLGPVDLTRLRPVGCSGWIDAVGKREHRGPSVFGTEVGLDWVIVGGESGTGARPMDIEWARSIVGQCKAAGVACFVKQLGAKPQYHTCRNPACTHPDCGYVDIHLHDKKGGDPSEWPKDLMVREMPR